VFRYNRGNPVHCFCGLLPKTTEEREAELKEQADATEQELKAQGLDVARSHELTDKWAAEERAAELARVEQERRREEERRRYR
jgi:hypothetical protein